ncbi:urease accessory protein UreD [Cellulosimicrobium sp. PMB13]|uniref:urease accessory protein UreD n=1 Tax=Cellulosimicrobium sp. PMB13 TaxID=3120158 RepID=UPI003F4B9319
MDGTTRVGVTRAAGRVRCDLRPGALSARVLSTGPGVARVALVATRALLLGGDHVRVEVHVGEGVELELVEVSGTVAYTGRGRAASWSVDVVVEAGGLLVWDALPFVVAEGADVARSTDVRLGAGAVALLRETLVLGRTGETGGRLRSSTRAEHVVRPVLAGGPQHDGGEISPPGRSDPVCLEPARELFVEDLDLGADRALPGILGTARVVDSVLLLGARPPALHPDDAVATGRHPLRLDLDGPGAVARHLGASTHDAGLDTVVATWAAAARAARSAPLIDDQEQTALLQTTGA